MAWEWHVIKPATLVSYEKAFWKGITQALAIALLVVNK